MIDNLIVVSEENVDLDFGAKIAQLSGLSFQSSQDLGQIAVLARAKPQSILFCQVDGMKRIDVPAFLKPSQVFGLAKENVYQIPAAQRTPKVGHYLVRSYDSFAESLVSRLVAAEVSGGVPFSTLKEEQAKLQTVVLKNSREKNTLIDAFRKVLNQAQLQSRAVEVILTGLDEILMNAIYDAPRDIRGRYYQREHPRDQNIVFSEKEQIQVTLTRNADFLILGVKDQFGSLSTARAFEVMSKNYHEEAYVMNEKTKSAGLGIHGIVGSGVSLILECTSGVSTEALLVCPYFGSLKEMRTGFRMVSISESRGVAHSDVDQSNIIR